MHPVGRTVFWGRKGGKEEERSKAPFGTTGLYAIRCMYVRCTLHATTGVHSPKKLKRICSGDDVKAYCLWRRADFTSLNTEEYIVVYIST